MCSIIKRGIVFALALLALVMGVFMPSRKVEAAMMYNNVINAVISCSVDSSGRLQTGMVATGVKGVTTRISVELFVEKRVLGIFWTKVDIGCTNNVWTDYTTGATYNNSFSTDLPSSGTYRITVIFTVSGTGGSDDVIERTKTITY